MRIHIYKGKFSKIWFCHIMTGNVLTDEVYRCGSWEEAMERARREMGSWEEEKKKDDRH